MFLFRIPKGSQKRFAESFSEESKTLAAKIDRTASMVSKIMLGKAVSKEQVPKLIAVIENQTKEAEQLKKVGATSFDLSLPNEKRRRKGGQVSFSCFAPPGCGALLRNSFASSLCVHRRGCGASHLRVHLRLHLALVLCNSFEVCSLFVDEKQKM